MTHRNPKTVTSAPASKTFTVAKPATVGGRKILDSRSAITIAADPRVISAMTSNVRLPFDLDPIRLHHASLRLDAEDSKLTFLGKAGSVAFSGAAGVQSGLGVYSRAQDMLEDLAALSGNSDQKIPFDEISFAAVGAQRYFAFYWGYDVRSSVTGGVALGPGAAVSFGAQGARNRGFAVIQAHAVNPNAGTAVNKLLKRAWMLPSQIQSADDLEPGTWIMAEAAGSFSANVGVHWDLDFSWIRSVKVDAAEVLEGDVGLKIQAGFSAAFGFSAAGRHVVIVGRDSLNPDDKVVRVRLNRLSQRGWDFAFHSNLDLTSTTGKLVPGQVDDLTAAILGVHGLQTLEKVRRFADPSQRLSDLTAEFLNGYARNQLGESLEQKRTDVQRKLQAWFRNWDALPSQASSALWDAVRLPQSEAKAFVETIRSFAAEDTVGPALEAAVRDLTFASTPAGKWLLGVTQERLLNVAVNRPEAKRVQAAATTALEILNGNVLDELQDFVETKVGLPALRRALNGNGVEDLNKEAKMQLGRFLGRNTALDTPGLETIRQTVDRLASRGDELYKAGLKALNRTYKLSFDYAYSRSSTKTGLLDVSLDFGANGDLGPLLERVLAGDFTSVLPRPGQPAPKGVLFHEAALTHGIQRRSQVKIELPFFSSETIHKTSSVARFRLADEDGGLHLYELDAGDDLLRKSRWRSTLGLGLSLAAGAGGEIRRHDRSGGPSAAIDYRFRQTLPAMRTVQLERLMRPLAELYFASQFADGGAAPDKLSVHEWALALDKVADAAEASEDGLIGDTLMTLDVSLPGDLLLKWLEAPEDDDNPIYMEMSRVFQRQLRRVIPFLYFQDVRRYRNALTAQSLMVWAALPVTTSIRTGKGGLKLNANERPFWNWPEAGDSGNRAALLGERSTAERLRQSMLEATQTLASVPDLKTHAQFYRPDAINLGAALQGVRSGAGRSLLESLLFTEATLIQWAVQAGRKVGKFQRLSDQPEKAVQELAEFGDKIVRTFNSKLDSLFDPKEPGSKQLLRNLGLMLFAEVTAALDGRPSAEPAASLELAVFRPGEPFNEARLLEGEPPSPKALSVRQRVLTVGSTAS